MAETIGVAGEFDAEQFNRGLNRYISALLNAERATEAFTTKLNSLGASTSSLTSAGPALLAVSRAIASLNRSLTTLSTLQLNQQLPTFLNQLAAAGSRIATVAPGMATAGRAITSFSKSITSLSGVQLSAAPLTRFVEELFTALSRFGRFKTVATTVTNLRSVVRSLQQLSTISLSAGNIVQFTQQFAPAMLTLSRALRNVSGIQKIPTAAIHSLSLLANSMRNLGAITNVGPAISALQRLVKILPQLNNIPTIPKNIASNFGVLANSLGRLGTITNLNPVISALRRLIPLFQQLALLKPIPQAVLSSIQQLGRSIQGLGNTQNLTQLSQVLKSLTTATRQLSNAQAAAIPNIQKFGSAITQGIGVGVGFGVVQALQSIGNAVVNLGRDVLETIKFFERFEISLESVIARTFRAKDPTLSFADALGKSQRPAAALMRELERIDILSPFTTQEVAAAFQLVAAYGSLADEALGLTEILIDFASGTGLFGDVLGRLALAFSQLIAHTRLRGQEANQFAEAGIPLYEILGEKLGKTRGELLKMQEAGELTADIVLPAIIEHMRNWEGAGKRVATTFTGLLSTMQSIKQFAFRDLFGNMLKPLQPVLQEMVDFFTSNEFKGFLQEFGKFLGEQLLVAVEAARTAIGSFIETLRSISPETKQTLLVFGLLAAGFIGLVTVLGVVSAAVIALVNPFTLLVGVVAGVATAWIQNFGNIRRITENTVNAISRLLENVASSAVKWGENIVSSLARGITQAVGLIVRALQVVGRVIGGLLRPGSPPKLLPHLTRWGAGAAEAYLEGWTQADFSALDSFAGIVRTNLNALATLGGIKETAVPKMVVEFRQLFTQAIAQIRQFGEASQEIIARIADVSRLGVDAISGYLSRYAAMQQATDTVNQAQKELNETIKQYDAILKPLNRRLREVQDAQQDIEDEKKIAKLRRILANQGITDARRLQAELELEALLVQGQIRDTELQKDAASDAVQTKLDAAKEAQDAAKEELDLFETQIKNQLQIGELLAEEARMRNQLADDRVAKEKEGLTELEKQLKTIELQQEALKDLIDAAEQRHILTSDDYTVAQKKTAELRLQEIELRKQLRIAEAEKLGLQVDFSEIEKIPIVLADFLSKNKLKGEDDPLGISGVSDIYKKDLGELEKALDDFEAAAAEARKNILAFFDDFGKALDNINAALPAFLRWKSVSDEAVGGIDNLKNAVIALGAILAGGRIAAILRGLPALIGGIATKANAVGLAIGLLSLAWTQNWGDIQTKTKEAVDYIDTQLGNLIGSEKWEAIKKAVSDVGTAIKNLFFGGEGGQESTPGPSQLIGQMFSEAEIKESERIVEDSKITLVGSIRGLVTAVGDALTGKGEHEPPPGVSELFKQSFSEQELNESKKIIERGATEQRLTLESTWSGMWQDLAESQSILEGISIVGAAWIRAFGVELGALLRFIIGTALPGVIKGIAAALGFVGGRIDDLAAPITPDDPEARKMAEAWENHLVPAFKDAGKAIGEGINQGILDFIAEFDLEQTVIKLGLFFLNAIKAHFGIKSPSTLIADEVGKPIGEGLIHGFVDWITENVSVAIQGLKDFATALFSVDNLKIFYDQAKKLGKNVIDGIIAGWNDKVEEAKRKFKQFFGFMFGAGEEELETGSPSKKAARELGAPIALGILAGLEQELDPENVKRIIANALAAFGAIRGATLAELTTMSEEVSTVFTTMQTNVGLTLAAFGVNTNAFFSTMSLDLIAILDNLAIQVGLQFDNLALNSSLKSNVLKTGVLQEFTNLSEEMVGEGGVLPTLNERSFVAFDAMYKGVIERVKELITDLMDLLTGDTGLIKRLEDEFVERGFELGESFAEGIADGILETLDTVEKAAAKAALKARDAGREALQAQSPSRRTEKEMGVPFGQGFARGILSEIGTVISASRQLTDAALLTMQARLGSFASATPVAPVTNNSTRVYNLNVNSTQSSRGIVRDFSVMEVMAGV